MEISLAGHILDLDKAYVKEMIMWKSYKYLFYKLFKLFIRINGKDDVPEYTTMFAVATLLFCNLFAILNAINVFFPFWSYSTISRGRFLIYLLPYTLIFYFAFIFNKKYERIIEEFKKENEEQRRRGRKKVILYIAASLIIIILSLSLIVLKNEGMII